jgi:hypothetical protein
MIRGHNARSDLAALSRAKCTASRTPNSACRSDKLQTPRSLRPFRFAAPSGVAVEACFLANRKGSESRRTCGSAGRTTATGSVRLSITTSAPYSRAGRRSKFRRELLVFYWLILIRATLHLNLQTKV